MSKTVQKTYSATITEYEDGIFVGRCGELHANSQGDTFGEAFENTVDAMRLAAEELGSTPDFNVLLAKQ